PRFNKTFLEYANYRGFLTDAARPRHPKDKPIIENGVRYARERFWKGETFIDLDDVWRRSQRWCRDVAGRRIHGTTRRGGCSAAMPTFELKLSVERSKQSP